MSVNTLSPNSLQLSSTEEGSNVNLNNMMNQIKYLVNTYSNSQTDQNYYRALGGLDAFLVLATSANDSAVKKAIQKVISDLGEVRNQGMPIWQLADDDHSLGVLASKMKMTQQQFKTGFNDVLDVISQNLPMIFPDMSPSDVNMYKGMLSICEEVEPSTTSAIANLEKILANPNLGNSWNTDAQQAIQIIRQDM